MHRSAPSLFFFLSLVDLALILQIKQVLANPHRGHIQLFRKDFYRLGTSGLEALHNLLLALGEFHCSIPGC